MNQALSLVVLGAWLVLAVGGANASNATEAAIADYHAMFGDDNPAELWQLRGAELWRTARGPQRVSLAGCDLGEGAGVVEGAYVRLPRWFQDTGSVQDLESRLLTCMVRLQGFAEAELVKARFGEGVKKSDLEALTAYVVAASRGHRMAVSLAHPAEQAAYELGRDVFFYRAGSHDFSCNTCHGESGKRIRLQTLPKLRDPAGARAAYTSWPAYRVSQGELRTMDWRLQDCFRQQRLPQLRYGSEVAVALTMFLAKNAAGGVMTAPNIKR